MTGNKTTYWTTDRIMRLIISLVITATIIALMRYLSGVLLPFFVACFIAYLLQPLVDFNKKLTRSRGLTLPAILTVVDVTAILAAISYIFIPSIIDELDTLGKIIHSISSGQKQLPPQYAAAFDFISRYFDPDNLRNYLDGTHLETLLNKGTSLLEESLDIVLGILSWLLTLIYIIFILIDYPQISRGFKLIIPSKYRSITINVVHDVENNMNRYFRGQGLVALCATVFYCIGFSIVGLPLAIPMGLLVGILYMIPYFQYVTLIPIAAICFIYSLGGYTPFLPEMGKCLIVYAVSQSICDYIITPHVMGKEMGMNPAIILLSLSVWGSLLGIIGMIIALPASALIMTYYRRYISEPVTTAQTAGNGLTTDDSASGPNGK